MLKKTIEFPGFLRESETGADNWPKIAAAMKLWTKKFMPDPKWH